MKANYVADPLFVPINIGGLALSNRIVMAPMTRGRAGDGDVPTSLMVDYYRQRASAGLLVTEGVQPTPAGKGYWRTPGIHSEAQIEGWRAVTNAVHERGGRIVMQIMHCGRVVVPENRGYNADVIAPSAIPCPAKVAGPDGVPVPTAMPRAIMGSEIPSLIEEFATAATNAIAAGMDGVELHCASGYLINQFLNPISNLRDDDYGGGVQNRIRFPVQVLEAMSAAIGADRVGFRISPGNPYNGMDPANPADTFIPFVQAVDGLGLAYLHLVDMQIPDLPILEMLRSHWSGAIIANNNLKPDAARMLLDQRSADVVSFGRAFIANPDLAERLRDGAPLAKPDFSMLYVGDEKGYTDYPSLVTAPA
jgi:N-ethylmaleimide reductase